MNTFLQFTVVLVTALLINTFSYCSAENVYCVIPATTSCSSCPHDSLNCTTLSEYAQEAELYFTSDTTMVFLPGDHTLDTNITVANVDRLTMHGESSSGKIATVVCSGPVGLSFTRMVEFKMCSLAFTSCRRLLRYTIIIRDYMYTPVYGAMSLQSTQYAELVNCSFHDNNGTALLVDNTNITLAGNTELTHNKACGSIVLGGAIIAVNSNLTFTGNTTFLGNSAISGQYPFADIVGGGGAIYTSDTVLSFSGTNNFINNSAGYGGGAIWANNNTVLSFSGTNNFLNNSAGFDSGAIWANNNTVPSFSGTNNFLNNSVGFGSGVIMAYENTVLNFSGTNNFINNSADEGGGGVISTYENTVLSFSGTNNFINNSANYGGVILTYKNTALYFSETNNFINNSADGAGGVILASESTLSFSGANNFINNSAFKGGAISSETNNTLTFSGIIYFTNNGEVNGYTFGGGVYLGLKSTISILPNTTVYWENNHARFGGAIYVADVSTMSYCTVIAKFVPKEECFFQLRGQNLSNGIDVQFVFKNNFAGGGGSMLYGGAIDNCILTGLDSNSSGKVFDMIVHNNHIDDNTTSTISSDPLRICYCENNLPNCSGSWYHFAHTVYLGETFQVSVVAVGQKMEQFLAESLV